jgi:hypothetical protein
MSTARPATSPFARPTVRPVFAIALNRKTGTYVVKVRALAPTDGTILATKTSSHTFRVR